MVNYNIYSNDSFNFIKCSINYIYSILLHPTNRKCYKEDASRISHLVEKADNKSLAIQHSQELIDGTGGVIIMSNKNMSAEKSYNLIKKEC